jgi:hypothetical protein
MGDRGVVDPTTIVDLIVGTVVDIFTPKKTFLLEYWIAELPDVDDLIAEVSEGTS